MMCIFYLYKNEVMKGNLAIVNCFTCRLRALLRHELAGAVLRITELLEAELLLGLANSLRAHLLSQRRPDLIEVVGIVVGDRDDVVDHVQAGLAVSRRRRGRLLEHCGADILAKSQITAKVFWVHCQDIVEHIGETNVLDDLTNLLLIWRRRQTCLIDQIEPRVGNVALGAVHEINGGGSESSTVRTCLALWW